MYSILIVCSLDGQVRPTPVVPVFPGSTALPRPYEVVLPENEFLVRTVVKSNMTILHNRIEDFKRAMEANLTSLYRTAYGVRR